MEHYVKTKDVLNGDEHIIIKKEKTSWVKEASLKKLHT